MPKLEAFYLVVFILLTTGQTMATPVSDSCLKLVWSDHYYDSTSLSMCMNPDSVRVDTCASSATYGEQFSKKWWGLVFTNYVISLPKAPDDTNLEVSWTAIDPSFNALRYAFSALEAKYGKCYLKKLAPTFVDSININSRAYSIRFEEYSCVDSVLKDLSRFPELYAYNFSGSPTIEDYVPNDRSLKPATSIVDIQPDAETIMGNGDFFFQPYWHTRGFGWSLYSIDAPMAWEITQGKSDVVVCAHDSWGGDAETTSHPDIVYRTIATPNGNWLLLDPSAPSGDPQFYGDGFKSTYALGQQHGSTTLPLAIGLNNNDNLTSPPSGALSGVAPKCLGIAISEYDFLDKHLLVDVDGLANNGPGGTPLITHPDIFSYSYHLTSGTIYKDILNAGCIQVAAAGNEREYYPNSGAAFPSAFVYEDPNHPTEGDSDVKIIAVAALEDGELRDEHCNDWFSTSSDGMYPQYTTGTEWFNRDWNYSHGTDKYNTNTSTATRIPAKEDAHVDVVAPAAGILVLRTGSDVATATANVVGGSVSSISVNYGGEYGFTPDVTISGGGGSGATAVASLPVWPAKGDNVASVTVTNGGSGYTSAPTVSFSGNPNGTHMYEPNESGTSQATPIVAGIAALMVSVQKGLGQSGRNVQKKAYDILTFTADKLTDIDNISSGLPKPSYEVDGIFPYVEQTNDPLGRWWTQRMGFGKVNAYRAVAWAIPTKGEHEYTASQTLDFSGASQNENSNYLMHFGARNTNGDLILGTDANGDYVENGGGITLPTDHDAGHDYNNQGETLVNSADGSATTLTVGNYDILAIDGIVKQTDATLHNNIIQSTGSGKLLAEGMIQDVELKSKAPKPSPNANVQRKRITFL